MSFPVPVEYGMNDSKDNTIVKYNNGDQWEGLPDIPGVRPENIFKYMEIIPDQNIDINNALRIDAPDGAFAAVVFALDSFNPNENYNIAWCGLSISNSDRSASYGYGKSLSSDGSYATGLFMRYSGGTLKIPSVENICLPAGLKYAIYIYRIGEGEI